MGCASLSPSLSRTGRILSTSRTRPTPESSARRARASPPRPPASTRARVGSLRFALAEPGSQPLSDRSDSVHGPGSFLDPSSPTPVPPLDTHRFALCHPARSHLRFVSEVGTYGAGPPQCAPNAHTSRQRCPARGHTPRLATSVISLPSTPSGDDRASDLRPLEMCLLGAERTRGHRCEPRHSCVTSQQASSPQSTSQSGGVLL